MGIPTKEQLTLLVDGKQLAENMQMQDANYQLDNYQFKKPNKKGIDILIHIIHFHNKNIKSDDKPSNQLHVQMKEAH